MAAKIINFTSRAIDKIVSLILILCLLIGVYVIYDNIYVFNDASGNKTIKYRPDNAEQASEVLQELSKDCVAWIKLDDSPVDYPVMQGKDNSKYLSLDPYGNYSLSGSIFLDSRNSKDFSDKYNLLYGHHMANNLMFGALDLWLKRDYFDSHLTGELITSSGVSYEIYIFAVGYSDTKDDEIFNPSSGHYPLQYIKEHSTFFNTPISENGKIIVLSTCTQAASTERLILCGILKGRS